MRFLLNYAQKGTRDQSVGYLSLKMSLFRPVVIPCMFPEIIFSIVVPLKLLFSYMYVYLGLKVRQENQLCLRWVSMLLNSWFPTLLFFPCSVTSFSPLSVKHIHQQLSIFHSGNGRFNSYKECLTLTCFIFFIYLNTLIHLKAAGSRVIMSYSTSWLSLSCCKLRKWINLWNWPVELFSTRHSSESLKKSWIQ